MVREISAPDLSAWLARQEEPAPLLVDVREEWEWNIARIDGAIHMPMQRIPLTMSELPDDRPLVIICHHGVRSYQVALYLDNCGFENVISLAGGVAAWAERVDPAMAQY